MEKNAIISERDRPRQRPIRSDFLVFPEMYPRHPVFNRVFIKSPCSQYSSCRIFSSIVKTLPLALLLIYAPAEIAV